MSVMSDHPHILKFHVIGDNWLDIEREAAALIRKYTNENSRGRGASSDGEVLRSAVFTVTRQVSSANWRAEVEVTV